MAFLSGHCSKTHKPNQPNRTTTPSIHALTHEQSDPRFDPPFDPRSKPKTHTPTQDSFNPRRPMKREQRIKNRDGFGAVSWGKGRAAWVKGERKNIKKERRQRRRRGRKREVEKKNKWGKKEEIGAKREACEREGKRILLNNFFFVFLQSYYSSLLEIVHCSMIAKLIGFKSSNGVCFFIFWC